MIDPLSLVSAYGLKAIGTYAAGYMGWKLWPRKENFRELMRITFIRAGLFVTIDKGKDKQQKTPNLLKFEPVEWGFIFKYRLIPGLSLSKFIEKKDVLDAAFNGECNIFGVGNELTIEVMRRPIPELEYFEVDKINHEGMAIPCPLGVTRKGIEVIDFAKAPHGINAGETGGGKSVFVRQFLTAVALIRSPKQVSVTLIDLKYGMELSLFEHLPHVERFVEDAKDVQAALNAINRMMNERGQLFRKAGVRKIEQYNAKVGDNEILPHHLLIIDELAEIEDTDTIERISRLGRALGVHMLLCTQRPSAKVLDGEIKANCPLKICFQVINGVNSRIILDNEHAKYLPPIPGRAIVQFKGERQIQALLLEESHAEALLKPLRKVVAADEPQRTGHRPTYHYI